MQIKLEHVNFVYQPGGINETTALHEINLTIASGETVAVIGHGGSGKSTLALLLAGLYQPSNGKIVLSGGQTSSASFRSVGLVFQYPEQQLFGETVFEEVAFGAKNFGTPQDFLPIKVRQALEDVGLNADEMWNRSPFSLSGGQKRRVCIACVLAINPQIIVMDEPTAGMDESGRRWMRQLVKRLHDKGRTVVWITHDMEEAASVAHRIIVLDSGRIVLDGRPNQVFAAEDILRRAHLAPPLAAQMLRELKRRGAELDGEATSVEGVYTEIADWLQRRDSYAANNAVSDVTPAPLSDVLETKALPLEQKAAAALQEILQQSNHADDDDTMWERQAAEELRSLVKPIAKDSEQTPIALAEEVAANFDLSGLTGEESPRVAEWRGGDDDA